VKNPKSLESIAHHEAAHYVASYVLRPDADRYIVTIKPGSGYLGIMSGEGPSPADDAEPGIIELFAGYDAEKR